MYWLPDQARHAGHVHDPPPLPLQHVGQEGLHAEEGPGRVDRISLSQSSSLVCADRRRLGMPALFTRMSTGPSFSLLTAASRAICRRVADVARRRPDVARPPAAARRAGAPACSRVRPQITTAAPASASAPHHRRADPWPPPVTTAVLPASGISLVSQSSCSREQRRFFEDGAQPSIRLVASFLGGGLGRPPEVGARPAGLLEARLAGRIAVRERRRFGRQMSAHGSPAPAPAVRPARWKSRTARRGRRRSGTRRPAAAPSGFAGGRERRRASRPSPSIVSTASRARRCARDRGERWRWRAL